MPHSKATDQHSKTNPASASADTKVMPIDVGKIQELLETVVHWPPLSWWVWTIMILILVILSSAGFSWSPPKPLAISFGVSTTSVILLSLLWLPAIIRLIATFGGRVHTPAGDIETDGLLHAQPINVLGLLSYALVHTPDLGVSETQPAQELLQDLQDVLQQRVGSEQVQRVLHELAHDITERLPRSPDNLFVDDDRATQLTALIGILSSLIPLAKFSNRAIAQFVQSRDIGQRILGLVAVSSSPNIAFYQEVISYLRDAYTYQERYWSLRAVQSIISVANPDMRRRIHQDIESISRSTPFNASLGSQDVDNLVRLLLDTTREYANADH